MSDVVRSGICRAVQVPPSFGKWQKLVHATDTHATLTPKKIGLCKYRREYYWFRWRTQNKYSRARAQSACPAGNRHFRGGWARFSTVIINTRMAHDGVADRMVAGLW